MAEPVIRLDRSKPFSENRGEMTPDDPLYRVRFWQGGTLVHNGKRHIVLLPFDANDELVPDDNKPTFRGKDVEGNEVTYQPLYSPLMREYLAAKKKRMTQIVAPNPEPAIEDEGETETDVLGPNTANDEINLVAWLRGEAEYHAFKVRNAVRERYGRAHQKESDVVVDLVFDEKLVPEDQVCPRLRAYLVAYEEARKNAA